MTMRPGESLEEFSARFRAEHAHDPLGPVATRVLIENDRVRIWELTLEPGECSALHRHELDYMVILLEGDRIAGIPGPESTHPAKAAQVEPGKAIFMSRGGCEWAVNLGERPYRELLVELKD